MSKKSIGYLNPILGLSLLILVIFTGSCSEKKAPSPLTDHYYGVWANQDCQLVRTGKFSLLFQRYDNKIACVLQRLTIWEDSLNLNTRGIAIFDTSTHSCLIEAKDLYAGEDIIINTDQDRQTKLTTFTYTCINGQDSILIGYNEKPVEIIRKSDNSLRTLTPNGTWQEMQKIENIELVEPYNMRVADSASVATCLQEWSLGTGRQRAPGGYIVGIPINTNRHSFAFVFTAWNDNFTVYCRAARIHSSDKGTVFSPNIRLIRAPELFEIFMAPDLLAEARQDLEIVPTLFNPAEPTVTPLGEYWSLKAIEDSVITLNGIGQYYYYVPTAKDSDKLLEWFKYVVYDSAGVKAMTGRGEKE